MLNSKMVKSVKTAKRNSKFYKLKHWKSSKYTGIEWKNKKYRYTYIDIHTRIIFVFISLDISCQEKDWSVPITEVSEICYSVYFGGRKMRGKEG